MENATIWLANPSLRDRLYTLAAEYSVSPDLLINLAVKRLLEDVELLRDLRTGKLDRKKFT